MEFRFIEFIEATAHNPLRTQVDDEEGSRKDVHPLKEQTLSHGHWEAFDNVTFFLAFIFAQLTLNDLNGCVFRHEFKICQSSIDTLSKTLFLCVFLDDFVSHAECMDFLLES